MTTIIYPTTPKIDQVDEYHGISVPDPYRWLEETDSAETRAWIDAQNDVTIDFLDQSPAREAIKTRMTELWDFPKVTAPIRKGERYFQLRNTGLQNQNVLFVMEGLEGEARVLLDPNALSEDGTAALNTWSVSKDGNWLAYAISQSGSDWVTWRIRDVATGEDLPDVVEWSKFSGAAWLPDGSGFYYSRYDAPRPGEDYTGSNYYQKLYLHIRGTSQSEDVLIYERPDQKEWGFRPMVTDDGRYLLINIWIGTGRKNLSVLQDLQGDGTFSPLITELDAGYDPLGNDGSVFYFRTDLEAPNYRVIAIDADRPEKSNWQTLVPEQEDVLETCVMVHNEFICLYLHDAHHALRRFSLDGADLGEIELPGLGAISAPMNVINLTGNRKGDELFFGFWSFLVPPSIYRFDFETAAREVVFSPPINFDPDQFVTRQVFATSRDGTRVPMFLTHKKDLALDGSNLTMLYGYGGFNIPMKPLFDPARMVWIERGGVLAYANLRGGGEYGKTWHDAGKVHQKQNVFDDFIACAEWLIEEKITSPEKLAIHGRSNGGLLVGACMTQRPDLFGAAIPQVGVMDMLRFERFTIGWAWVSDYGSVDNPHEFESLFDYSPLHNLKSGTKYPATLVTTGDHDDRVVPGHSFKFAAALQAAHTGDAPVLIRIDTKAGHGMGKPTAFLIQEWTDIFAFLEQVLG